MSMRRRVKARSEAAGQSQQRRMESRLDERVNKTAAPATLPRPTDSGVGLIACGNGRRTQDAFARITKAGQPLAQLLQRLDRYQYDVFLSHASEDKDAVARPLAIHLQQRGLRVWYDEFEFRIGDNIVDKLNRGISGSRFGALVLSRAFIDLSKQWTRHEMDALEYLWITENRILFPIWHNITLREIRAFRASLANLYGLRTSAHSVDKIAAEIYAVIRDYDAQERASTGGET